MLGYTSNLYPTGESDWGEADPAAHALATPGLSPRNADRQDTALTSRATLGAWWAAARGQPRGDH